MEQLNLEESERPRARYARDNAGGRFAPLPRPLPHTISLKPPVCKSSHANTLHPPRNLASEVSSLSLSARRLRCPGSNLQNVCVLQTPEDAKRIAQLAANKAVMIAGASFIGTKPGPSKRGGSVRAIQEGCLRGWQGTGQSQHLSLLKGLLPPWGKQQPALILCFQVWRWQLVSRAKQLASRWLRKLSFPTS